MYRFRKNARTYRNLPKDKQCPFCHIVPERKVIEKAKDYLVVENLYPYDVWEGRKVLEHLLLIPRQHVGSLHDVSKETQINMVEKMAEYERNGYDVYARASGSVQRSIHEHQHSHLIKTDTKHAKFFLLLRKPYLLVRW